LCVPQKYVCDLRSRAEEQISRINGAHQGRIDATGWMQKNASQHSEGVIIASFETCGVHVVGLVATRRLVCAAKESSNPFDKVHTVVSRRINIGDDMKHLERFWLILATTVVATILTACSGDDVSVLGATAAAPPRGCTDLAGMAIPAASIALPTTGGTVKTAVIIPANGTGADAIPEYCLVNGSISPVDSTAPKILFQVALPTVWNSKVVMFGGGGFDGSIPAVAGNVPNGPVDQLTPLGRGYATFASDSGHQANALGSQDGSSFTNDEAVRNFGGDALKKTHDAALFLINARYAAGPPKFAYFAGGSTGGREALASIQRWPEDWNGAIAWYPAWNDASALLFGQKVNRTLAQPGAYPDTAKKGLVSGGHGSLRRVGRSCRRSHQ